MKIKTVRVRRSRPSAPALALALMLTMLCVYLASLSAADDAVPQPASAQSAGSCELHMDGMTMDFECVCYCDHLLDARVQAANCVQAGGAGLLLSENDRFAVVRQCVAAPTDTSIRREAAGLTLRMTGSAASMQAVSDAVSLLHALAAETGNLPQAIESGDTDGATLRALLEIYRTQARRAQEGLKSESGAIVDRLRNAVQAALLRLDAAISAPSAGAMRRIRAYACEEWICLLNEFTKMQAN